MDAELENALENAVDALPDDGSAAASDNQEAVPSADSNSEDSSDSDNIQPQAE